MFLWRAINVTGVRKLEKAVINNPLICGCYYQQQRLLSAKPPKTIIKQIDPETGEVKKKKINEIPQITLLQGDSLTVTTLIDAEKLAKRRDLKLVKIVDLDTKSNRPVYKLMTPVEFHEEDVKQRETRKKDKSSNYTKGEKVLMINDRISDHDLDTNLRRAEKWLAKKYEVNVVIGIANSTDKGERIFKKFEQFVKQQVPDAKIVQKRTKGTDLKFQIMPPNNNNNNDETTDGNKGENRL